MHNFFTFLVNNFIRHTLIALIAGLLAFGAIFLFTGRDSKLREWLLAKDKRIESFGIAILVLIWLGFFVYNRVTGT